MSRASFVVSIAATVEEQKALKSPSIDSLALFRAALPQISNTDSVHHAQGELFEPCSSSFADTEAAAVGEDAPSGHDKAIVSRVKTIQDEVLHPSIDGKVRFLEGESAHPCTSSSLAAFRGGVPAQALSIGCHPSIDGKVRVLESKSVQDSAQPWPSPSQAPSISCHLSIDGKVRVLEDKSVQEESAEPWPSSTSAPSESFEKISSASSHGIECVLEGKSIVLPHVEHVWLNIDAAGRLPSLPSVSKTETPWVNENVEPCTDADEASLAGFPSPFPSFKRIPGTRFIVDGFRHAGPWSRSYFLSHFHSDHYTGLSASWNKGIIFCSHITARLVIECIKVPLPFICPLPMGEPVDIDSCCVTLVDANHCPGAVQFLFQVPTERSDVLMRYVHTGDMRYSPDMNADPSLCDFVGADAVFLDTTYCNPKFVFPTQNQSISYIAETVFTMREEGSKEIEGLAHVYDDFEEIDEVSMEVGELQKEHGKEHNADDAEMDMENLQVPELQQKRSGSTLFLISTYVIGKEKILLAVSKRCNCLIYVNEKKLGILKCLDLENLDVFTTIPSTTNVHVVSWNFLGETWPFFRPNFRKMEELLKKSGCHRIVGFVPTGWTYETKKKTFSIRRKGPLEIHLVPYSEHSNYDELRQYVAFLRPHEIIPTVGLEGGDMDSKAVAAMRKHFRNLVDETASKRRFLKGFSRKSGGKSTMVEERCTVSLKVGAEMPISNVTSGDGGGAFVLKAADFEGSTNVLQLQSGAEQSSSVLNYIDTREFPKAAFGKGAKKRQRGCSNTDELEDSVSIVVKREKAFAEEKCLTSSGNELGIYGSGLIYSKEKEEQLRTVLPKEVSEKQMHDLLLKANGDLDRAVTLYFEGSLCSWNDQQGQAVVKTGKWPLFVESDATEKACSMAQDVNSGTQIGVSQREIVELTTGRKAARSASLPVSKRVRGSQASILTFFKKSDLSSMCSTSAERSSSWDAEHAKPMNTGGGIGNKGVISRQNSDPCAGLDQILTILGGVVAVEKAKSLLEQSHGDVGAALDLYYRESCSSLPEVNSKDVVSESIASLSAEKNVVPEIIDACFEKKLQALDSNAQQRPAQSGEKVCKVVAFEVKNDYVARSIWEYKPVEYACWSNGEPAPYVHLARTFDLVEQESGRLKTSDMLCNMFRSLLALSPEAVLPAVYLSTNRIAPDYENVDLSIGGSTVSASIVEATGTQRSKIKEMYNTMGDLGDVAQACRQTQSLLVAPRVLSIQQVFSVLLQISKETGSGSSSRKKSLILGLLRACREKEMKYIVRTLVQNMRIGAMMRSVLPALAQAIVLHTSNSKNEQLKAELHEVSSAILEAYNFMPNLNVLVPALLQDGIKTVLTNVTISPGIPVKPMLAKITNGIAEVFKRFQGKPFTCEYKYDGQRAQVHVIKDGSIKIFSRNCEDTTSRFPDVLDIVRMALRPGIQDLIFDAEIVAVDRGNSNKLMAFQHLSTRERGRSGASVSIENIKVDVCLFVFDLMYADGNPLVKLPFSKRRARMHECFKNGQAGCFDFANQITIEASEANLENSPALVRVESFLEESITSSCEGMMVKALDEESTYVPSKRSDSWLKVKRDYIEGLHDTLDLVPIGAWHGNGRKAGWFSPFLVACYDSDREEFQSVCRVMSGFTDAFYKQMKAFFSDERVLQRKPTYYRTLEDPDVWFTPELVWEIRGADLTVSPVHQAAVGLVHPSRGISLRFPRFIKVRPDKNPEDASSPSDIADLFQQQSRKLDIPSQRSGSPQNEEDT